MKTQVTMKQVNHENHIKIENVYQNLAIEERWLRQGVKTIKEADDAETNICSESKKGVDLLFAVLPEKKFWSLLLDATRMDETDFDGVYDYLLKAKNRGNGGDIRLDLLLNFALDSLENQEEWEWLNTITNDYFLNYATAEQKTEIASTFLDLWEETVYPF